MAISDLTIKNAALLLVGAEKLTGETDKSKAGRLTQEMYELSRNEMFDLPVNWKFATCRATLSALSADPDTGYDHQYVIPADCRRIIAFVDEDGDETEYKYRREVYVDSSNKERDVILTDEDDVYIKYIRLRIDPAKWPGWFAKLVYTNLAKLLCEPLKQDKQKARDLFQMFESALDDAIAANGMEDADVDGNNANLDKGNTDVISAASLLSDPDKEYIWERNA